MYEIYDNMILRFNLRKHNLTTVYVLGHKYQYQLGYPYDLYPI